MDIPLSPGSGRSDLLGSGLDIPQRKHHKPLEKGMIREGTSDFFTKNILQVRTTPNPR